MVKKLLFSCGFLFITALVYARLALSPFQINVCNAPPPDSFRVTSIGYNFVSLAWNPPWQGAAHSLSIFEENNTGGWDSLYSVTLVNANYYSVQNMMQSKKHKFEIKTICSNGMPSDSISSIFPPHGLILELTLNGKSPINPVVTSCTHIDYRETVNEWIGFKLSKYLAGKPVNSNFFQVEKVENEGSVLARIKSVDSESHLVAANLLNEWPNFSQDVVESDFLFRVGETDNQDHFSVFGHVQLVINSWPDESVDICPFVSSSYPWDYTYKFEPILAQTNKKQNYKEQSVNQRGKKQDVEMIQIKVQSFSSGYLKMFFADSFSESELYDFNLVDINGKNYLNERINVLDNQISIPIGVMRSGIYFLRIESKGNVQNLKVFLFE